MSLKYSFQADFPAIIGSNELWILADSSNSGENMEWLVHMTELCPDAVIYQIFPSSQKHLSKISVKCNVQGNIFCDLNDENSLRELAANMQANSKKKQYIISTTPYDSYGEWVKSYEQFLVSLLKMTAATYVIHDLHHGLFRFADRKVLHERTHTRRLRLALYKKIVSLFFILSKVFIRTKRSWVTIKGDPHV